MNGRSMSQAGRKCEESLTNAIHDVIADKAFSRTTRLSCDERAKFPKTLWIRISFKKGMVGEAVPIRFAFPVKQWLKQAPPAITRPVRQTSHPPSLWLSAFLPNPKKQLQGNETKRVHLPLRHQVQIHWNSARASDRCQRHGDIFTVVWVCSACSWNLSHACSAV